MHELEPGVDVFSRPHPLPSQVWADNPAGDNAPTNPQVHMLRCLG